jgi:hypothetical protein
VHTELLLQQAGGRREHHVGRAGRNDDEVDVRGVDIGRFEREFRGHEGQIAADHIGRSEVARLDAGALDDPLIGSLDASQRQLLGQCFIAQAVRRQVAAGARDP